MEATLPWYIAGPLLGLMIPVILILNEKQLGVSSTLRVVGSFIAPGMNYFRYDRTNDFWQLWFAVGILAVSIIYNLTGLISNELMIEHSSNAYETRNWSVFFFGGIALGFGSRYAGGCTAGHCLMGNSLLAKSSIITTISFFIGGLIASHFIIPIIY